ncbi:MAG TPA: hypothetical protein VMU68_05585 [Acidimicrobiales bacterium]|nr:hypothetical protein [Acidimicrobiales bacterium]
MILATLQAQALDAFQALTLFVAFVTVLFGVRYSSIASAGYADLPGREKPEARKIEQAKRHSIFWAQCVPLVCLTAMPIYVFLPLAFRIVSHGLFRWWGFDVVTQSFVLLTAYLLLFFSWTVVLGVRVAARAYEH